MTRTLQLLVFALCSIATAAFAQTPPPNTLYFKSLKYNGTGCPLGTVAESVAPDQRAFTLTFSQYVAEVTPYIAGVQAGKVSDRKNCQLTANIHIPQGWSFAIVTVDYRGYVDLGPRMTATQKSTIYWQGELNQATPSTSFSGPASEDYLIRDTIPTANLVWSKCGVDRALNVNTAIQVNNSRDGSGRPSGYGSMTTDSLDGVVRQVYGVQWRQCP